MSKPESAARCPECGAPEGRIHAFKCKHYPDIVRSAAKALLCRVIGHRWAWIFEGDWECARCGGLRTNTGYVVPSRFARAWRPT